MNRRLGYLEMALIMILGAWAAPLAAQTQQQTTPMPQAPPGTTIMQVYAVVPVIPHDASPPGYVPGQEPPPNGPVRRFFYNVGNCTRDFWQRQGFCCWDTHNSVGCGNLTSDLVFMFGSCRQFFGEPCMQAPPPEAQNSIHQPQH
jgi:hypothetical protein